MKKSMILLLAALALAVTSVFVACSNSAGGGGGATPPAQWTVSFDLDGGVIDGAETFGDVKVNKGKTLGNNLKTPTREGSWEFAGWFDESVEPPVQYQDSTPITKDVTLKAKWNSTDTSKWVVEFETDGGSTVPSIQVTKGEPMGSQYPEDPEKSGFSFEGWYLASDTTFSGPKYEHDTPITANTVLKAKWALASVEIAITMVGDEGDDNVTPSPTSGQTGAEITLSYTLANTKKNNRLVFSGVTASLAEVDVSGPGASKTGSTKYTIDMADATDGKITVIATFTHSDKTLETIEFEDNLGLTKYYGDESFTRTATSKGTGGTGAITYESSDETVATVNSSTGAVTILKVGTTTITATKAEDANYSGDTVSYLLTVEKKSVSITGLSVSDKVYDGTTSATVTGTAGISGKVGSDDVTVSSGTAAFANKNVGTGKTVSFHGYNLSGTDAGNYELSLLAGTTADITALQLTIPAPSAITKAYDGNATVTVTPGTLENKIATDTVTVSAVGTYTSANAGTSISVTVVYSIDGADAGNYTKPVDYTGTGTITKATGRTVSVPTLDFKSDTVITVNAVTVTEPAYGQTAEYTISTDATLAGTETWQDEYTFTELTASTDYYVFARSKGNDNCNAGEAQVSSAITTEAVVHIVRQTVVDFEDDATGATTKYTGTKNNSGDAGPTVTVINDPVNSGQKSLQVEIKNWDQAVIIPIYLPYALSNYKEVLFRFKPGANLSNQTFLVFAAKNSTDFVAGALSTTQGNANYLIGNKSSISVSSTSSWTELTIPISIANATTQTYQGTVYIAMGIRIGSATYQYDDITFVLKDDFVPTPYITPVTGTFDQNGGLDIPVTVTPQGKTLTSITGGSITTSDYTVDGNIVTINKVYLTAQTYGSKITLTFTFSDGTTRSIEIEIDDSLLTRRKYDFTTYNTTTGPFGRGGGTTQALADTVTASTDGSVLKVSRTSNNNIAWLWIPFYIPDAISQYKTVEIMWKTGTGDMSSKPINIYLNVDGGTPQSPIAANTNTIGSLSNGTNNASSFVMRTVPISTTGLTNKGAIEIGIGVGQTNTSGANFEIQSIELKK